MLDHVKTSKAGSFDYQTERMRGTVDVWHDSSRYVYRKPRSLKAFKREILAAFGDRCMAKIEGKYPSYTVETWA